MRVPAFILFLVILTAASSQDPPPRHYSSLGITPFYLHFDRRIPDNISEPVPELAPNALVMLFRRSNNDEFAIGLGGGAMLLQERSIFPVLAAMELDAGSLFRKEKSSDQQNFGRSRLRVGLGTVIGDLGTFDGQLKFGPMYHAAYRYRITNGRMRLHAGVTSSLLELRGSYRQFREGSWHQERASFFLIGPSFWVDL